MLQVSVGHRHWVPKWKCVRVPIKSPGLPFIQNWGSITHNSVWVGLGCAVLRACWQGWGSIPCHTLISSWPSTVTPPREEWPISIWLHNTLGPRRSWCLTNNRSADDNIQAHRKAAAEKILCQNGREWSRHYWIKCIYFLPAFVWFMNCFSTVGKKCSISEDCLCSLTPAQNLEYSHFRNSPVFPDLRGQNF